MADRRVHPVNAALIAHSVPLCGCERLPFLFAAGIGVVPIAATGVTHWQPDLFGICAFFPLWGGARLLYLYDQRSSAKLVEHLSWVTERYSARVPFGSLRVATSRFGGALRLMSIIAKQAIRS